MRSLCYRAMHYTTTRIYLTVVRVDALDIIKNSSRIHLMHIHNHNTTNLNTTCLSLSIHKDWLIGMQHILSIIGGTTDARANE